MSTIINRDSNTITVAIFWENFLLGKYAFDPPYQRKSVWSEEKQSFFIDSILKNFPVPPIFLHQKIDLSSGKTQYDVIDGKQRLNSIIRFIKNEIPSSAEHNEDQFFDDNIDGVYFRDLDHDGKDEYKKRFWRYVIPIEYIDTDDHLIIDNIFDRLNRNGEKLNGQELRKSMYHSTPLLKLVEELAETPFWKERLETTDVSRMEHFEFISELVFQLLEKKPLLANPKTIDDLYKKYATTIDSQNLGEHFLSVSQVMSSLNIDYEKLKVSGVSHLYGLWCFSHFCEQHKIDPTEVSSKIEEFYSTLRSGDKSITQVEEYRKSMSSRTKDETQRRRRMEALISFCT